MSVPYLDTVFPAEMLFFVLLVYLCLCNACFKLDFGLVVVATCLFLSMLVT